MTPVDMPLSSLHIAAPQSEVASSSLAEKFELSFDYKAVSVSEECKRGV